MGADVGLVDPYPNGSGGGGGGDCEGSQSHTQMPAANDIDGSCYLNGAAAPCSMVMNMLNHGAATMVDLSKTDEWGRAKKKEPKRPEDDIKSVLAKLKGMFKNPRDRELSRRLSSDSSTASSNTSDNSGNCDDPDVNCGYANGVSSVNVTAPATITFDPGDSPRLSSDEDNDLSKWMDCISKIRPSRFLTFGDTKKLLKTHEQEGTDLTLMTVTWQLESGFDDNPLNGRHERGNPTGDIGPGQLYPGIWEKSPFTDGLRNPFGSARAVGDRFNGDVSENLMLMARAYNSMRGTRSQMAGLYKAGSTTGPGYQQRVTSFNQLAPTWDRFYNCLAGRAY